MSDSITIDGLGPMPVVRPSSAAEVAEVVRRAAAEGTALYPVGGGTTLDYGLPPARSGIAVNLRALDKVIDFPAQDMTITVEAGITVARLNEITRGEGLHLPIDVPEPEQATLGGAIACNVSGPRRYGYGTFRDYVLGITTVNDRGELVSAGGRVVKNVAGYDLMKLHTGALGTLGIITQVTLRLRPVPEAFGAVTAPDVSGNQLAAVLDQAAATKTRPVAVIAHQANGRGPSWPDGQIATRWVWSVMLYFEGPTEAVSWQQQQSHQELLGVTHNVFPMTGPAGKVFEVDHPPQFLSSFVPPSRVAEVATFAGGLSDRITVGAYPGSGIVQFAPYNSASQSAWDGAMAARIFRQLLDKAAEHGGNVVLRRGPTAWKSQIPVWGHPPSDLALQKAVKRALDPKNIFNPGRFVTDAF